MGVSRHALGGWGAPLGIDLYADGLSLVMLTATALVGLGVSVYSADYFQSEDAARFWPLWLFLLAALNGLFLAADIFNVYVTLEMIGLAAVALAALPGDREALSGAMRYLLATLLGSSAYLFGVALLYHRFGSVDIAILALRVEPSPVSSAALWTDGCRAVTQDSALSPAFLAPSRPCQCPGTGERAALGPGGKGLFLYPAAFVADASLALSAAESIIVRTAWCGGHPLGFPAGPAPDAD